MNSRTAALIPLALLALGVAGCEGKSADLSGNTLRTVHVATVRIAALDDTVRAVGLLTPKDEIRLSFKVSGVLDSIPIEEGQAVKAGKLLAELKQTETEASVEQAHQNVIKAQRDLARGQSLLTDGVATEEQVQDLTTAYKVASAQERGVQFNADHARIVAGADGVVLRKLAEKNELVQAGQTVLVLGGADRGWIVRSGLADRDVVRVRTGDSVQVAFDAWPGSPFVGHVSNIASAADSATGTFAVEVQVQPGSARFVQGLVAKVMLTPHGAATGPIIPVQALLEASDKEAGVFVLDSGRPVVHRVTVQIGRMHHGDVEVLGGLAANAQVVIDGAAFLDNGDTVRVAP
jgi:membrane fusion protein, multidrug efflux system